MIVLTLPIGLRRAANSLKLRARLALKRRVRGARGEIECHQCGSIAPPRWDDTAGRGATEQCANCGEVFVMVSRKPGSGHAVSEPVDANPFAGDEMEEEEEEVERESPASNTIR